MKSSHVIASFAGHILLLLLMGFTAAALHTDEAPKPGSIRVSFGELPRPGERENEPDPVEIEPPPAEPEPELEPIPEDPPLPADEEPVILDETPPAEEPAPPPPPAPELEAVKPVSPSESEPEPEPALEDLPTLTEQEPEAELHSLDEEVPPSPPPAAEAEADPEPEEPRGTSVQASGSAGAGDAYLGLVQSKVGRRWHPSAASTAGRPFLEAVVSFHIGSRGQVTGAVLFENSGLSVFDRSALRAVMESDPLPPPPTRFRDAGLDIQFTFTYRR